MKNKKASYFLITVIPSLLIGAVVFLFIRIFGGTAAFDRGIPVRLEVTFLLYIGVSIRAPLGKARIFDSTKLHDAAMNWSVAGSNKDSYSPLLKKLGGVPLKTMASLAMVTAGLMVLLFVQGESVGIAHAIRIPLLIMCMAISLLGGAFSYVLSDGLVSQTLSTNDITVFPRTFREGRQALKMFIIPVAVAIIALLYGIGSSLLAGSNSLLLNGIVIPFFLVLLGLATSLKRNAGILYETVIEQLDNLSSEKKDLTRRINVSSVDELGTISGMVNDFTLNMENNMRAIKKGQNVLSASGEELGNSSVSMSESLDTVSSKVEDVKGKAEGQLRSVDESSAAVHEIAKNIESLDGSINRQSQSVSQASAAVEEMVGNIDSISSMSERMLQQFKNVAASAQSGGTVQSESAKKVEEIVKQSESLQEANRIIATIASQTNLLAMNAAIEAAHAGDAGRGFAVVADEIRKLAENSSAESGKISSELKTIAESINSVVKGSSASAKAFEDVINNVSETEKLVTEVEQAVRQQQEGAGQVLDALKVMNGITMEVSTGSKEMNAGNASMLNEISKLQANAHDISESVERMAVEITKLRSGAQKVADLAKENAAAIGNIGSVVDTFVV